METKRSSSLIVWTLLGVVLIVLSYIVTISLAIACVALLYTGNVILGIGGLILGLTIFWSLVPRRDKFEAPGPTLTRENCPALFRELDSLSSQLNEKMPADVYLVPSLNAFVAERGGWMGFGRRRIMGIGLPLVGALSVDEFRAVLAHEFGHYYRGDTRMGPWLYQARAGMVRTLQSFGDPNVVLRTAAHFLVVYVAYRAVAFLLINYWKLFLRATLFMSRKQEFRADELAAQIAGAPALASGLKTIIGAEQLVDAYWKNEVGVVVGEGFHPPIGPGFAHYLMAPDIKRKLDKHLAEVLKKEKTEAFSTHPLLRDRLTALSRFPQDTQPADAGHAPATSLFENLDQLELEILYRFDPALREKSLTPCVWEGLKTKALLNAWHTRVATISADLRNVTVVQVPDVVKDISPIAAKIPNPPGRLLDVPQRKQQAYINLAAAVALVMQQQGWELITTPGQFEFRKDGVSVNPFALMADLVSSKSNRDAWITRTTTMGIAHCELVSSMQSATAS